MHSPSITTLRLSRRAWVKQGVLVMTAGLTRPRAWADQPNSALRFGLVTDLHYADKPPGGSRHYRETLAKLAEVRQEFSAQRPEFVVELGDLIDSAGSVQQELEHLKRINQEFSGICSQRHYVLGNHCVDTLTKEEFLAEVEREQSYYSFDHGGFHFIVLDACFRADGTAYGRKNFVWTDANIPSAELAWLRADLTATTKPTIVFAHQRLDVNNQHGVKNCADVRSVLQDSEKVLAVFQGHSHQNDHQEISGIHYCTLVAMVEGCGAQNNGYSIVNVAQDGTMKVSGFRKQHDYRWPT